MVQGVHIEIYTHGGWSIVNTICTVVAVIQDVAEMSENLTL